MLEFIKEGGPFMLLLLATSIVALAFIIERGFALRRGNVIPRSVEVALEACQSPDGLGSVRRVCSERCSPLSRLVNVVLDHLSAGREEAVDALETRARQEVLKLERGLVVLEVVVGIAPLLGLVGTIQGLITLFRQLGLASTGVADNAILAQGISIALNTTLMGLLIAIPALVAWSYYVKKVETLAVEMEAICDELLRRQSRLQRGN